MEESRSRRATKRSADKAQKDGPAKQDDESDDSEEEEESEEASDASAFSSEEEDDGSAEEDESDESDFSSKRPKAKAAAKTAAKKAPAKAPAPKKATPAKKPAAKKPAAKKPATKPSAGSKKKGASGGGGGGGGGDDSDDSENESDDESAASESSDDFDAKAAKKRAAAQAQAQAAKAKKEAAAEAERHAKAAADADKAVVAFSPSERVECDPNSCPGLKNAGWRQNPDLKVKWGEEEVDELPVLTKPEAMFADIVKVAHEKSTVPGGSLEGASLKTLAQELNGRPLKVATMCSGTESPLLALDLICKALHEQHGVTLNVEHAFSCEIEPFKQAYIERNFAPPILFRDIRELDREQATTAYGAKQPVPGGVDILIAGTSCVDYSNLNTKQKGIDQKGESGQTFWGMLGWVIRHRPPMVIQENVCGAPWDKMKEYYAHEGYAATFLRVDTKQHYVPHTRTRVYLLAIDMAAPNRRKAMKAAVKAAKAKAAAAAAAAAAGEDVSMEDAPEETKPGLTVTSKRVNELPKWLAAINELSRPSSSSLEAFLLPTDDPRVHRGRADMSKPKNESRKVVDWGRCITRHERARTDEMLGSKRPLTRWVSQGE